MSTPAPEGVAALLTLAEARPDLAGRVAAVLARLARIEPRLAEPHWGSPQDTVRHLVALGVADEDDAAWADEDPARLSALAHRALDRGVDPHASSVEVANACAGLALVLGAEFEPFPAKLADLYDRARDLGLPHDVPRQVAWIAGHRGADALVDGLAPVIGSDPVRALDFLDAVLDAYDSFPLRGAPPPETDYPTGETAPVPPSAPSEMTAPSAPPPAPKSAAPGGRVRDLLRRALSAFGPGEPKRTKAPPAEVDEEVRAALEAAARPVVSVGFCERRGGEALPKDRTLGAGRRYELFVLIAPELVFGAIDTGAAPLPPLAAGTVLQVVLFGFDGELAPVRGADVGELRVAPGGTAVVHRQPGGDPGGARLYLPVDTPAGAGRHRLRCNLYHRQVLLQSRLVEAEVTAQAGVARSGALRSTTDFAVSEDLGSAQLALLEPRTLSVLVNDNGNGTHGFRFFGAGEFKRDVTITGESLAQQLEQARKGLRLASWGTAEEPTRTQFETLTYRYAAPSRDTLAQDLATLARSGFKVWDLLVDQLSAGDADALAATMRAPGRVELANKQSLDLLVPAACLYDYPLDPEEADLATCPAFLDALGAQPLAGLPCFHGACPSYDDPRVVCPSGFWGFRHQIGYSATLTGGEPGDARTFALTVGGGPGPVFVAGASSDRGLTQRDAHLARLAALAGDRWSLAMTRTELFALFRDVAPSVVYLYGHGGTEGGSPYFEVGTGADGPIIRASLRGKANWKQTHPLVFLNGCHSAALSPSAAFSYATGFLQTAHASAVLGTEIAVFESLAVAFAEECLRRFVTDRRPLGEAVLGTRIALLERGVPLGLAYLAFGPTDVRLAA